MKRCSTINVSAEKQWIGKKTEKENILMKTEKLTGLILGNRKESVAQFSFLMVLAPILGKMVLDLMSGELAAQSIGTAPLLAGFAAAFVVGCLACKFMINIVKRGKLNWFAIYCTLVGGLAIIRYFVIQ